MLAFLPACGLFRGAPEDLHAPLTAKQRALVAARLVTGAAAGAAFVPIGAVLALRARRRG